MTLGDKMWNTEKVLSEITALGHSHMVKFELHL